MLIIHCRFLIKVMLDLINNSLFVLTVCSAEGPWVSNLYPLRTVMLTCSYEIHTVISRILFCQASETFQTQAVTNKLYFSFGELHLYFMSAFGITLPAFCFFFKPNFLKNVKAYLNHHLKIQ